MFLPKQGRVKVTLRDVTGREVYSQEYFKPAGRQKVDLSLEGIRPQLYFYTVEHESGSVTKRLIVK
ncbi:MAG TPA: T9SS type A sorting domain-containing protein, partial [Catalimonadaceae bacterium]|nr:T9SS type A sorting domain-containing protein [Catalimonadaceae bacterium]